jgi:hypothetical protein
VLRSPGFARNRNRCGTLRTIFANYLAISPTRARARKDNRSAKEIPRRHPQGVGGRAPYRGYQGRAKGPVCWLVDQCVCACIQVYVCPPLACAPTVCVSATTHCTTYYLATTCVSSPPHSGYLLLLHITGIHTLHYPTTRCMISPGEPPFGWYSWYLLYHPAHPATTDTPCYKVLLYCTTYLSMYSLS